MKDIDYAEAYAEVLEVLNYIPMEDYNKIPKKFITFMEENYDEKSSFKYNIALPFEKQGLSDKAKNILALISKLFWMEKKNKS